MRPEIPEADRLASAARPLARYLIVGLATNAFWYGVYLVGTALGVPPLAMATIAYVAGVATSYMFNRSWSFGSGRGHGATAPRYAAAYLVGYLANMALLYLLYVRMRWPHELAQLVSAAMVAVVLFLLLRLWVFPLAERTDSGGAAPGAAGAKVCAVSRGNAATTQKPD